MHYNVYCWLNVSVFDSNMTIIRKLRKKIKKPERKGREKRESRHALYRGVLKCHANAQMLHRMFRL